MVVVVTLVREARALVYGPMPLSPAFMACGILWIALRYFAGLYPGYGLSGPEVLRRSTMTTVLAALGHTSLLFALHSLSPSRIVSIGSWALLIPACWLVREGVQRFLIWRNLFGTPAIILGAGETGTYLVRELKQNRSIGIVPVAIFDDNPAMHGSSVEGVPIIGSISELPFWRPPYPIREAIIAITRSGRTRVLELVRTITHQFPRVSLASDMVGLGSLWARTHAAGTFSILQVSHDRFDRTNRVVKRAFDLVVGIPIFFLSLPIIIMAAVAVKLCSPGKAFYTQTRQGLGAKKIRVWKIRTMVQDADAKLEHLLATDQIAKLQWEERMKLDRDPRIVRIVGSFLRRSSIDELPQLWNVIKGEMSLVGPRPFPDYHLNKFNADFRELRRQVPPGVTGYWQITHRSEASLHDQEVSDTYYINNWSLWLDLWVLFKTVGAVLNGKGAR